MGDDTTLISKAMEIGGRGRTPGEKRKLWNLSSVLLGREELAGGLDDISRGGSEAEAHTTTTMKISQF